VTGSKHGRNPAGWLAKALMTLAIGLFVAWMAWPGDERAPREGSIRVLLIPADGGTANGTLADFRPLFATLTRITGLRFDLTVTQSYSAAVEGICAGTADMAFVGPAAYLQARQRDCAKLLAVGVKHGKSRYYAGIFVPDGSPVHELGDLRGRRMAFGDVNSTSSFLMPVAMLQDAGIDPARDLSAIRLTGSHPNSLSALLQGRVDAAAFSLDAYDRALRMKMPGAERLRIVARSEAMPYPPFIVSTRLDPAIQERLRQGFAQLSREAERHAQPVPGYAGSMIESYSTTLDDRAFDRMAERLSRVTPATKAALLRRAAEH